MISINSVLCVDDNNDSLELLKIFFELEGYEVVACTTHQECFDHIKTKDFSAIVLDCWLAGKDGIEICSEIRESNTAVPIIFYTADATEKSRRKGLEAGANAYLLKPDDIGNVVPIVIELITQTQLPTADQSCLQTQLGC